MLLSIKPTAGSQAVWPVCAVPLVQQQPGDVCVPGPQLADERLPELAGPRHSYIEPVRCRGCSPLLATGCGGWRLCLQKRRSDLRADCSSQVSAQTRSATAPNAATRHSLLSLHAPAGEGPRCQAVPAHGGAGVGRRSHAGVGRHGHEARQVAGASRVPLPSFLCFVISASPRSAALAPGQAG